MSPATTGRTGTPTATSRGSTSRIRSATGSSRSSPTTRSCNRRQPAAPRAAVFTNLNNTPTMTAYYNDLKLLFQKAGAFPSQPRRRARRARPLGLHAAAHQRHRRRGQPVHGGCGQRLAGTRWPAQQFFRIRPGDRQAARHLRAERRARLSRQRLGHGHRHRAVQPARCDHRRARRTRGDVLQVAERELRHRRSPSSAIATRRSISTSTATTALTGSTPATSAGWRASSRASRPAPASAS